MPRDSVTQRLRTLTQRQCCGEYVRPDRVAAYYVGALRVQYPVIACRMNYARRCMDGDLGRSTVHHGRVKLLLMADTHIPQRARDLPEQLWRAVDDADVVVHAGDWVCVELLDALLARADRLLGVVGNNDGPALSERLPEVATAELAGIRLAVVHETGSARGREQRCAASFPDADVLVFGHSHIPWDTVAATGLRLLNPGSPTDRRRQPTCSWMTTEIISGQLGHVKLHRPPVITR